MAITAEQTAAILAELSVDLATVTDDRLIELCLLYRSAPSVLPTFTDALATEITRRFTAAEIAANDVMFSVIQNFSNTFDTLANYQTRMYELSTTDVGLRNDWFRDNATFFYELLHDAEALAWLVTQTELVNYIYASTVAFDAVFGSSVATTAFVNSQIAMTAVAASSTAMAAVIASSTAMAAVIASSTALSAIVKSTSARNALMSSNTVFQNNRVAIYNTVKASWTKQAGLSDSSDPNQGMTTINAAVASPAGFVFASLGWYSTYTTGISNITHPDGTLAVAKGTSSNPTTLANLDAISFNSATFKATVNYAQAYAELWTPPA